MIDATEFPDLEDALVGALQAGRTGDVATVSNKTPPTIDGKLVTVGYAGGGSRDWGEAAANAGINVYAQTDDDCRDLVQLVLGDLAVTSGDLIEHVRVPLGATAVPRQAPPFQRYLVVTAWLRGQSLVDPDLS